MVKKLRDSKSELLMIDVLRKSKHSLNMTEIVEAIIARDQSALSGKTPEKSLYSIIYRREKRRKEHGLPTLFTTTRRGGSIYYELRNKEVR